RDGVEVGGLVDEIVSGLTVAAAGRGVNEARHTRPRGGPGQPNRCGVIDVVGDVWVEVPQRVVGEGSEVHDGIEAFEVAWLSITEIELQLWNIVDPRCKRALPEQVAVKAH